MSASRPARAQASTVASARLPLTLLGIFLLYWIALAIAPLYRQDWILENVMVVLLIPTLLWAYRRLRFSNTSYVCLFVFLVLHEIGAHYTYAEVPYDAAAQTWLGFSPDRLFGFERNHFDRAIHFLSGVLITPAVVELLAARAPAQGIWRAIMPVSFVLAQSALFELIEWAAAIIFGGDLGAAYLGTQGDPWDAHWDMLLAATGALLTMAVLGLRWPAARKSRA